MKLKATTLLLQFSILLQTSILVYAQVAPTTSSNDTTTQIRKEGLERSQIMRTLHMFTGVYGPRLTGSPNLKLADDWAIRQMKDWGFDKAQLES